MKFLRLSARTHLIGLLAAALIPVWLLAAYILAQYAFNERARYEREAQQVAQQAALVVEGEQANLLTVLRGLATSSALSEGRLEELYTEAVRLTNGTGQVILLRDIEGRQFFNTQVPFNTRLPPAAPLSAAERDRFRAGAPVVGGVYPSPISGEFRVPIATPVRGPQGEQWVLAITVPTTRMRDVLIPAVAPGWVVGIGDATGRYVTRSQGHDEFSGQPGLPEYLKNTTGKSGTFVSTNFAGVSLLAGYRRPEFSGWLFAANIPLDVVEAPLRRSIAAMGAVALIAMGLSAGLAYFFGAGFTRAATDLAASAQALGEGRQVEPVKTSVIEFARIGEALRDAQHAIETRKSELQTVLETVPAAVWFTYDPQARNVIRNRYAAELMGLPAKENRSYGVPDQVIETIATKDGRLVSREDRPLSRAMRGEQTDNEEFAYKLPSGGERHLMSSARSIYDNEGHVVGAVQISLDITARKREEEQRILLVNELNHRVKNTLAVVQAIASQTMRTASNFADARLSLESRLVSLSKAHDILTRESWNGADLRELLRDSIAPHANLERVKIEGPRVWLPPNLALSLSLVAHELATNAIKYGALANMTGIITIDWTTSRQHDGVERLHIDWRESGGRPVTKPQGEGFGSRILPGILQPECGSVKFSFDPAGLTCEIEANLEFDARQATDHNLQPANAG